MKRGGGQIRGLPRRYDEVHRFCVIAAPILVAMRIMCMVGIFYSLLFVKLGHIVGAVVYTLPFFIAC